MRGPLPIAYQHHADAERPKLERTAAEIAVLRKRHEVRKEAYIKTMTRDRLLTATEAARQYDEQHGRWS